VAWLGEIVGGPGFESVGGLAFDPNGNLIVNGSTQSTLVGRPRDAPQLRFIGKSSEEPSVDEAAPSRFGVATDGTGTIVLTGSASSASGAWQMCGSSSSLSPSLTRVWQRGIVDRRTWYTNRSLASPTGVADSAVEAGWISRQNDLRSAAPSQCGHHGIPERRHVRGRRVDGSWWRSWIEPRPDTPAGRVWTNDDFTSIACYRPFWMGERHG